MLEAGLDPHILHRNLVPDMEETLQDHDVGVGVVLVDYLLDVLLFEDLEG